MYRATERTQKRKDEKKQLIMRSAARVFSARGYHNSTVKDIVKEAAVSVGSFYFYFKGKEDLFLELYKSIVNQFNDTILSVLDVENNTTLKNYTRVMAATLWMYEQKREIARIVFLEITTAIPSFQEIEANRMSESAQTMTGWFKRFKLHNGVNIPDERVAAFMYTGTYYYLINDWLTSGVTTSLTDNCYAFCVYNLQALKIPFEDDVIKAYINEVLHELTIRSSKPEEGSERNG